MTVFQKQRAENNIAELIQLVSNVTESYTTALFIADNYRRILKLWKYYSLGDNVNPDTIIPFGVGPIGLVAENRSDFDLTKFSERDSSLLGIYNKSENIKSFFAVPIINADGNLEGVISIDSKKTFVFSNKDQKNLKLFAVQFANLIHSLRIEKFIDIETSDIEFLHNFSKNIASAEDIDSILQITFKAIMELIECDSYFISLQSYNNTGEFSIVASQSHKNLQGLVFSDQYGLAGCVIKDKKPFLLGNRKEDFGSFVFSPSESLGRVRSFLGIPLLLKDEVLGLICLIDSDEDSFNQRDLQVISIMADHISLALSNIKFQKEIYYLSTSIDGLTGLQNFNGLQSQLDKIIQAVSRKRRPLSLLVIDIDNFKEINRTFGHEFGNEILMQIAQLLQELQKNNNVVSARIGSDKFALALPNILENRAYSVAEELCNRINNPAFFVSGQELHVTVSIGISSFPENSTDKYELVNNALCALSSINSSEGKRIICFKKTNV